MKMNTFLLLFLLFVSSDGSATTISQQRGLQEDDSGEPALTVQTIQMNTTTTADDEQAAMPSELSLPDIPPGCELEGDDGFTCSIDSFLNSGESRSNLTYMLDCPLDPEVGADFVRSEGCTCAVLVTDDSGASKTCDCAICGPDSGTAFSTNCSSLTDNPTVVGNCQSIGCDGRCADAPTTTTTVTESIQAINDTAGDNPFFCDPGSDNTDFTCEIFSNIPSLAGSDSVDLIYNLQCQYNPEIGFDIRQASEDCTCNATVTRTGLAATADGAERVCACRSCPVGTSQALAVDCSVVEDDPILIDECSSLGCNGRCNETLFETAEPTAIPTATPTSLPPTTQPPEEHTVETDPPTSRAMVVRTTTTSSLLLILGMTIFL